MEGIVDIIKTNRKNGLEYGFIKLPSDESIYFDSRSLSTNLKMSDFYQGDKVEFSAVLEDAARRKTALCVKLTETVQITNSGRMIEKQVVRDFYKPGYYRSLDRTQMCIDHLKPNSGEYEVLEKLKNVLYISHVGHHDMGTGGASFPFCLVGTTEFLKSFIHSWQI